MLGLRSAPVLGGDVSFFGGGGGPIPITPGPVTVPRFRFVLGITYAPMNRDSDGDGVPDRIDRCPTQAGERGGERPGCPREEPPQPASDGNKVETPEMTVTTSNARHVLFRLSEPARLPDALLGTLRDEVVLTGWMRASGILHDVRLRSLGGTTVRGLAGSVQVVALEGSIGLSEGDVTCGLRAVLARETDTGLETIAGEIVEARVGALEVMVTAFDEVAATRQAGPGGVWLLAPTAQGGRACSSSSAAALQRRARTPPPRAAPAPTPAPIQAAPAPAPSEPKPAAPKPSPTFSAQAAMPLRPVRPKVEEEEQICPDAGDVVEHFAFGRCEVVKSDGDRLHLRLGKDGRVKEIALEMLRVTPLAPADGTAGRHFKLDRKL